jgi:hypothetical protein
MTLISKTVRLQAAKNKSSRLADRNYATWRVTRRKGYARISKLRHSWRVYYCLIHVNKLPTKLTE